MKVIRQFYCTLCRAKQTDREFILSFLEDIAICNECIDLMAETIRKERAKMEGKQNLEDLNNKQSD